MGGLLAFIAWFVSNLTILGGYQTVQGNLHTFNEVVGQIEGFKTTFGRYPESLVEAQISLTENQKQAFQGYANLGNEFELNVAYEPTVGMFDQLNCSFRSGDSWVCGS